MCVSCAALTLGVTDPKGVRTSELSSCPSATTPPGASIDSVTCEEPAPADPFLCCPLLDRCPFSPFNRIEGTTHHDDSNTPPCHRRLRHPCRQQRRRGARHAHVPATRPSDVPDHSGVESTGISTPKPPLVRCCRVGRRRSRSLVTDQSKPSRQRTSPLRMIRSSQSISSRR